ncbi:MAG TPA: short-chain fatty acyl-CoA regulator family protein [Polyangiales bacterium]|nr:short-chain fatty acyl-CoA regulator family protein [Polyangiales bacterium]
MSKLFVGPRLKRMREERGLTQVSVAKALDVSPSYYNQLENNQRPLTAALLGRVTALFQIDAQFFSEEEEGRLIADVREALTSAAPEEGVSLVEIRELASSMPALARALVRIHRREREASERVAAMANLLEEQGRDFSGPAPLMPYEEVRDFFYARHNYIAELDELAERIATRIGVAPGSTLDALVKHITSAHGVQVVIDPVDIEGELLQRRFDPSAKVLQLSPHLLPGQRAFRVATQLAFLDAGKVIERIANSAKFSSAEARSLSRLGLAHHFAAALLMPYTVFLETAERMRYDIDRIRHHFGVGFESACHRLSTLQRAEAPGVPFFFLRVDRAGNISKRQSATDFHFSRVGGTCPLWNVYEAFVQPGRILTQLAQMPDGRTYLWIARTVSRGQSGFGSPGKTFAIALGCDLRHAHRLIYSQGLDLKSPKAPTLIGMGCKVCDRPACPQRAFPPLGKRLAVLENEGRFEPYRVG